MCDEKLKKRCPLTSITILKNRSIQGYPNYPELSGRSFRSKVLAWYLNLVTVKNTNGIFHFKISKDLFGLQPIVGFWKNKANTIYSGPLFSHQICDILRINGRNHANEYLWYPKISQIDEKYRYVDGIPTLTKLQIS